MYLSISSDNLRNLDPYRAVYPDKTITGDDANIIDKAVTLDRHNWNKNIFATFHDTKDKLKVLTTLRSLYSNSYCLVWEIKDAE